MLKSPRRGITTEEIERDFARLGGTVDRSSPDHIKFQYPGLPTSGVHARSATAPAPRHLVSMYRKILEGKVAPPRAPIGTAAPRADIELGKLDASEHSNPPRPLVIPAPMEPAVVATVARELEERKAKDRAASEILARLFAQRPTPPVDVDQQLPLVWKKDLSEFDNRTRFPLTAEMRIRAFREAERDGMVRWWASGEEWREEMLLWLSPEAHRRLPDGRFARYGIGIVKANSGSSVPLHCTYWVVDGDDCMAVTAPSPAAFARFRSSWARGTDYIRAFIRRAGIAE